MADGANLELKFTASQDESVRQAFTALTKLLETLNKRIGSLSSSIDKLVSNNSKLKKSTKGVSDQNEETAKSYKKKGDAAEKAAEQEKKAAEKAAKAAEREAKRTETANKKAEKEAQKAAERKQKEEERATKRLEKEQDKRQKAAERAAEKERALKERERKRLEREAEKAAKDAERILEKERRERDRQLKQQEKEADRLAKEEAKARKNAIVNNFGDPVSSKTYMTNIHDTVNMMDMYHRKLEQINREDKRGTITHGQKLLALQQTEDAFRKHLKPIDEALARKVRINNAIEDLLSFKAANPELVTPAFDKAIDNLQAKFEKLDTITNRQAFAELSATFDFNKQFEKNLKAVMKSRVFTEADKDIIKLAEHGQFAVDIYKRLTDGMADESAQRKIISKEVDKYGKDYHKTMNTLNADLRELIRLQGMVTNDDALWNDYNKRISEKYKQISELKNTVENPQLAFSTYNTKRSSVANEIDKITKYSTKVDNLGKSARVLFDELNKGLDRNSFAIDKNYKKVVNFFDKFDNERRRINNELIANNYSFFETDDPKRIKDLGKTRVVLFKQLKALENQYSNANIVNTYAKSESGLKSIFEKWDRIGKKISWVSAAVQEIQDKTTVGSEQQRAALGRLSSAWNDYGKVVDTARRGSRAAVNELNALKASGASQSAIDKQRRQIKDIAAVNKGLLSTFKGIDFTSIGAYQPINKDMRKYAELLLQDDTYFGKATRRIASTLSDRKSWDSAVPQLEALLSAYKRVIPTVQRLIEVNGLSSDQAKKLVSDEFLKQAAMEKTTAGVKKAAEQQVGFNHVTRASASIFDRMASSMGSMARYAVASTAYYAFTNAIYSALDAVKQFDQSLKNLQAITDATDNEIALLGDEIKKVAVETRYGINEVAEGATIIGQAGFSATETMSILNSVMQLAQGSMSTVSASADLLTTVIAAFNLNASDAAMVADNMAAAMNYSKLDIDKLRVAFNYVGPVAMDAGVSLQEMSAVLMVLANNGMKASTIGTSLRNVFSQLQSPSAALRKAFSVWEDGDKRLERLADKSVSVVDKFRTLNESIGTSANLFKMFGLRAAGTVSILMKYPEQIQEMLNGLYTLGDAERMADKQMEGLANRMANFSASLEVLGVTMSEVPAKGLSELVLIVTKAVQRLTTFVDGPLGSAVTTTASLGLAIGSVVVTGRLFHVLFGTTLVGAFRAFNSVILWTVEKLMIIGSAMGATSIASSGLLGTLSVFASNHPVLMGIAAITAVVGGLAAAFGLLADSENEEQKAYARLQKELKNRREQVGLLRTAINANRQLGEGENVQRTRNNIYIAGKFPEISSRIMAAESKAETEEVLKSYLQELETSTIKLTRDAMARTSAKLQVLRDRQQSEVDWYKRGDSKVDLSGLGLSDEEENDVLDALRENMESSYLGDQFDEAFEKISDEIRTNTVDITNSFKGIAETARANVNEIIKTTDSIFEGLDEKARADKTSTLFNEELDKLVANTQEFGHAGSVVVRMLVDVEKAAYSYENSVAVADKAIHNMSASMTEMGLNGEVITKLYSEMGEKHMGKLFKRIKQFTTEYNKIIKAGLPGDEQTKQLNALIGSFNETAIKDITKISTNEIEWIEFVRKKEIDSINATTVARKEKARLIDEVNEKAYLRESMLYADLLQHQLSMVEQLENIKIDPVVFTYLINAEFDKIDPKIFDAIKDNNAIQSILSGYWSKTAGYTKAVLGTPANEPFGKVAKNNYDTAKNTIDKANIQSDIAYETGAMSYSQYIEAKIASDAKLLAARKTYLAELKADSKAGDNTDRINEETAAIAEMEAKLQLDAIKQRRDAARQNIELERDLALESIDIVDSELRRSDMNAMDRDEQLLANEETRIRVTLASMREEAKLLTNKDEQERKLLAIRQKELELAENIKEQERLAYENRTKYIEQEYKYGLQTKQDYRNYIEKQQREGTMNPYDAQKELWRTSDSPLDGFRLGIVEVAEATQTMNDYISEGVANFRDEWHSAMDEFVESWWDGTTSASEIFGDFVNNIAMDWQKRILKMYSDRMFEGFAKSFLPDSMQGIFGSYGGGRATNVTTDDGLSNPTATVTPAVSVGNNLALNLGSALQNVQSVVNANTTRMANDVATMSQQSTTSITNMSNGATNLWQYLSNGFTGLWNNISSGLSGVLASLTFATTSSSGGSFWERWLGNSIGMGFQLYSMGGSGGSGGSGGGAGKSMALSDSFTNTVNSLKNFKLAKGGVFRDLSAFSNSVLTSPTLFTYGEHLKAFAKGGGLMAEAGPEAIMPLTRDGSGRLGVNARGMSPCINNIYIETPEGYTAEQKSRVANNNGGEDIMFTIVKQTAANVAQPGSPMYRAMQNTFGASQVLTSR